MDRLLLRVWEAAEVAAIGRSHAYELVRRGEWPSVRVGRSIRVPAAGLRAWVNSRTTVPTEADYEGNGGDAWNG